MTLPPRIAKSLLSLTFALPLLACGRDMSGLNPGQAGTGGDGGAGPSEGGAGGTTHALDAATAGGGTGGAAAGGTGGDATPDAATSAPDGEATGPDAGSSSPPDAAAVADAGAALDGPAAAARCELPACLPLAGRFVPNVPRAMDFTFDSAGNFVAIEMMTGALVATPYQGMPMTLMRGAAKGFGRGIHYLTNGDLFLLDQGNSLVSFTPQGQKTVLAMRDGSHGATIDQQGRPIVAAIDGIYRLEGKELVALSKDPHRAGAVAFSPDYQTLYAATPAGELRKLAMSADGKAGPQQLFATIPKDSDTLIVDDLTVDECGNLFVVNASRQVWRVTPAGQTTKVVEAKTTLGGPSFGSGRGGWKDTALYVAVPSGGDASFTGALEVELGFRGMPDPALQNK